MTDRIRIKQYEQTADEKVSLGGIKWVRKWDVCIQCDSAEEAERVRTRLAQPEPEPVAWLDDEGYSWVTGELPDDHLKLFKPLYTAPPQREFIGLTDEEKTFLAWESNNGPECVAMTEAKLKEKNT